MQTGDSNVLELLAGLQQQVEQARLRLSMLQKSFEREQKALVEQLSEATGKIQFLISQKECAVVVPTAAIPEAPPLPTVVPETPKESPVETPLPITAPVVEPTQVEEPAEIPLARPTTLEPIRLAPLELELLKQCFAGTPKLVIELRQNLHYFLRHPQESEILRKIGVRAREIASAGASLECNPISQVALGLEHLITDMLLFPGDQMSKGALRTAGQALEFMSLLLDDQHIGKLQAIHSPILVSVDDESQAQRLVISAMEATGAQVVPCLSSHEALDFLAEQECSLVMLDLNMPSINGLDLCRRIRLMERHTKTPIVFVTGAATVENRAQSSLNGGNDFIAKPFQLTELALKALLWICKGHFGLM